MMQIDENSTTWRAIRTYLNERLAKCREKNDKQLDADETARLRGEIAAIKDLLALPARPARVAKDDPGYGTDSLD